ncbi:hypothetical protein EDB85DRAFT_128608 [Lactarius pseudohatsudake]|nr:hypothetical protein EDB85DRAFT_128608 [Lactarius pseudohatsudake]
MMVASLAALPRLKYLTLRFRKGTSHPERIRLPLITRTVLPSLTTFDFDGLFEYLEDFVAQIDTPQLKNLNIALDDDESVDFQIPQLCKFIDRSEHFKLSHFRRAQLDIWPSTVDIELDQSFRLSTQDVEISQVLGQISALPSNVDYLIIVSWSPEYEELLGDRIRWLELLHPFTAVKALGVQDKLSRRIVLALRRITGERAAEVLPALELLCLENRPVSCVKKFVAARLNTDHPVTVINERSEFLERLKSIVSK